MNVKRRPSTEFLICSAIAAAAVYTFLEAIECLYAGATHDQLAERFLVALLVLNVIGFWRTALLMDDGPDWVAWIGLPFFTLHCLLPLFCAAASFASVG